MKKLTKFLEEHIEINDVRAKEQAAKTIVEVIKHNFAVDIQRDRCTRLDENKPTEITGDKLTLEVRADHLLSEIGNLLGDRSEPDEISVEVLEGSGEPTKVLPSREDAGDSQ